MSSREIEFRGRTDTKWAYGSLVMGDKYDSNKAFILRYGISGKRWQVDVKTIGQFTGLCDKNDVKIYEGDIVHWRDKAWMIGWTNEYGYSLDNPSSASYSLDINIIYSGLEVIGNIYDNPELVRAK